MDLLCLFIQQPQQVLSRDEIVRQVWGEHYPSDEGVTRNISALRKIFRKDETTEKYIETIPTRGYRLLVEVETATPEAQSPQTPLARNRRITKLAVLAFENLSNDQDMAYFSDGISDEILQTVVTTTQLRVIARASSFQFRGDAKAAANIATQLGATHALDGSVRRQGNTVRIHANLIDCINEEVIWSQRYDGDLQDILGVQDQIAGSVAKALNTTFVPTRHQTVDPRALDFFLKGRAQLDEEWGSPNIVEALPHYEAAVQADPSFARAWALLAQTRAYVLRGYPKHCPAEVNRASVIEAAATALRLDEKCGIPYLALNGLAAWGDYRERADNLERALRVAPNDPEVIMAAANLSARLGRLDESISLAEQAVELDPHFPVASFYLSAVEDIRGGYERSKSISDDLLKRFPQVDYMWTGALMGAAANADWTRLELIITELEKYGPIEKMQVPLIVFRAMKDRDPKFVDYYVKQAREVLAAKDRLDLRVISVMYHLGAWDEAFDLIEHSSFAHIFDPAARPPAGWVNESIIFHAGGPCQMIQDPRFVGYCEKLGLTGYWVSSDHWPDVAANPTLSYDFKALALDSVENSPQIHP